MKQFVMRFKGKSGIPIEDKQVIDNAPKIKVLDATTKIFLVEAEKKEDLPHLKDWVISAVQTYEVPDTKVKLGKK